MDAATLAILAMAAVAIVVVVFNSKQTGSVAIDGGDTTFSATTEERDES